jgi:hypothetical protein
MQRQSAPRKKLPLRGFALGFLSLLAVAPSIQTRAATSQPLIVSYQRDCSDAMLTGHVEINLSDDVGLALEDSDEMLRVDFEERAFGNDQVASQPKVESPGARNIRPNISPPLLV